MFAVTNFLYMFFPRAAALFELVQHVFEAQALSSFGLLLFDLAADGETDYLVAREVLLAKLALCEPKKLDASPPLCFLAPCVKAVRVDGPRLDRLMAGLKVFGYVVPTCAIVRLWVTVEAKNSWVIDGSQIGLMLGMNVAMSYTLYWFFQLYVSTHDILHKFKPTDKFIAIKVCGPAASVAYPGTHAVPGSPCQAILGIAVFQDMVIKTVMKKYVQEGYFTAEMLSEFWADFALCCEAILLALAHMTAYPILELADESGGAAARRVAAKTHALEVLAQPRASHGDEEAAEERGAPRIAVVEVNPLAKIPWTLDMDEQQWPASSEAALWGPHRPLADKSSTAATSSRLAHERQL